MSSDRSRSPFMPRWVAFYLLLTGIFALAFGVFWEATADSVDFAWWQGFLFFAVPLQGPVWLYALVGGIRRWVGMR